MKLRVVVLGAGFGGLELASILSAKIGDQLDLILIDKNDSFFFGFSKFDVMFGKKTPEAVRLPYSSIDKPGVRFRQENVLTIDPVSKRVITDKEHYEADVLVIALGANYDVTATPGLREGGNEFYSFDGVLALREVLPAFAGGKVVVGVCAIPFKCPPAPSECALLMHDFITERGLRERSEITLVMPFGVPIPPSPSTSKALIAAFKERNIKFIPEAVVRSIDPARRIAILDEGQELPFDLFLGIPKHVAPDVVLQSGMTMNGWIPVDPVNLKTKFPGVYAAGDVTSVGTPKAGVFAEGSARMIAASILAEYFQGEMPAPYKGDGSCYIEFGGGRVGRVDVDFFSGPKPVGTYVEASAAMVKDKEEFGTVRAARWFCR